MSTQFPEPLTGALVISLDLELHWGVRDKQSCKSTYAANLHGARTVIPRLLEVFEEFDVAATWATVGFLFARGRQELEQFAPALRPSYRDPRLSPYAESVGASEEEDPLHFAPSLIRRIRDVRRQEIATHTFSHYYCGEEGQTRDTFRADVAAACAIASRHGIRLRSIAFPRNQHIHAYDDILRESGIRAYRGNSRSRLWRFESDEASRKAWKRAGRALDTYLRVAGDDTVAWTEVRQSSGLSDVRASCFLRPYSPSLRYLESVRLERIRRSLRFAARAGRIFHMWWHPHNFGVHQEENLKFLRAVLVEFAACRECYGMDSLSMADVDAYVRQPFEARPAAAVTPPAAGLPSRADQRMRSVRREETTASDGTGHTVLLHITTIPMTLTFLVGQVGYMKGRGLQVHAVSSPGPDLISFGREERVPVSGVEMPRRITPWRDLMAVTSLLRILHRVRPTIVQAHTPKGGLLGMIASWLSRVPLRIYQMRGLPLLGAAGMRRRLLWCTEWVSCRLAHQVLCVSRSIRDHAIREGLCPIEKIKVLARGSGNGVDASLRFNPERLGVETRTEARGRLGIPDGATVVGFVGRIVRDKGIVELTKAWQSLSVDHPELHLLLVGPFERGDPVPAETEALLRKDPRVHLAGMDWNTPPLYAAMDLVALPTYREGFPNVPLEAAAMGLPVVATRIPGCVDAVQDGVTGLLVPAGDAPALARAMRTYVADPVLRREHGAAGQMRVRRDFRQEVVWEALHCEYVRLLRERGLPTPAALDAKESHPATAAPA